MTRYLSVEAAKQKLVAYALESPVPDGRLSLLISEIEDRIDAWLDSCASLTLYTERCRANARGLIALSKTPIVEIVEIRCLLPSNFGEISTLISASGIWDGSTYLAMGIPHANFQVTYRAGYDPIPLVFANTVFDILAIAIQPENPSLSLDFLSASAADITSLTLPGGITQTFQVSKGKNTGQSTEDRLFDKLSGYRRKLKMA